LDFKLELYVAVASIVLALVTLAARRGTALVAGLLLALGAQTALHFVGVLVDAGVDEEALGATSFVGPLGAVLVVAAGLIALRSATNAGSPRSPPAGTGPI
jgi:hypothetical protein